MRIMLKEYLTGFVLHVRFLTRIPVPGHVDHNDKAFARGVVFAPVIGLIIGLTASGVYILFGLTDKRAVALFFALISEVVLTGGLHLDGLADTFDGLFSYRDRDRILAIMKDSRLGTNGAIALIVVIILKYVLLVALSDAVIISCIIAMPVLSRMTIAWSAGLMPYARKNETGMAGGLIAHTGTIEIIISTVIALSIAAFFLKLAAIPLALGVIAFTLLANLYSLKRIGGITGDVIGAVIELSEIIFLLAVLVLEKVYMRFHFPFI